ncbi:MAG: hypothetical protein QXP80_05340 [Zestosphaera sp.]
MSHVSQIGRERLEKLTMFTHHRLDEGIIKSTLPRQPYIFIPSTRIEKRLFKLMKV